MAKLNFDIWAHPAIKRSGAWVLIHEGQVAGRIVLAYPSDGAGIIKTMVGIWAGPLKQDEAMRGQAGGYGYDKASAAVADAFDRHGVKTDTDLSGRGMSAVQGWFESKGYQLQVIL